MRERQARFIILFIILGVLGLGVLGGLPAAWAIDESLQKAAEGLRFEHLAADDHRLTFILECVSQAQPEEAKAKQQFIEDVTYLMRFFVKLQSREQKIFLDMLRLYHRYYSQFDSVQDWLLEIKSFLPLFNVASSLQRLFPTHPRLTGCHRYWLELLNRKKLPHIGFYYYRMNQLKEQTRKQMLLAQYPIFEFEKKGLEYKVGGYFYVKQNWQQVKREFLKNKDRIFKKMFPWTIQEGSLKLEKDDGDEVLKFTLIKYSGEPYDLSFNILTEEEEDFRTIFQIIIPFVSELRLGIDSWEMICAVEPHPEFDDVSIVSYESFVALKNEIMEREVRMDETMKRIEKMLPKSLNEWKAELNALK